ncbi:MAG: tetratricopeptide repeat protein [Bacteroidia bacterium]|nr:tetratricopeptide repeat protein [Bacteroidia bacterium]
MTLNELLPKTELIEAGKLRKQLKHIAGNPFLALLAVDSTALHNALIDFIRSNTDLRLKIINAKDDVSIQTAFLPDDKEKFIILSFINTPEKILHDNIIPRLIYNRDYIMQHNLKHAYIGKHSFINNIQKQAFDLFSIANAKVFFSDKQLALTSDFKKYPEKPVQIADFEKALTDLESYRKKKNIDREVLLRKICDTAFTAYKISNLDKACKLYSEAITIAKELKNNESLSLSFGNIGLIYRDKGDLDQALKFHKQALEINKQIGYLQGQASDLGNIGLIYSDKGELDEALKYHKQALEIDKQIS